MKILVADDSATGLAIITAALKKLGHEVLAAASGEQAIKLFMENTVDLIILDVVMPKMNGFECAKKLREINTDSWIPIIFLSGSIDDESISQGIAAGGDDYLSKPFSEKTLSAKIYAMERIANVQKKLRETSSELSILSTTDVLTGVANRLQFDISIKKYIDAAKKSDSQLALLFLDLDHFKEVNDHLGHHTGDLLLKEIAQRINTCLRGNDFLARLGGDEFAIILGKLNHPKDAGLVAQRILDKLSPVYHLATNDIHSSCSIGIACYPMAGKTAALLTQHADVAMYYAKEMGRNNYQFYTNEFQALHEQQFSLDGALRFALENNELYMCYQPIFKLRTKELIGMEALMRWDNSKFGLITPDIFIPIAEKIGIITKIGSWALRNVCEQAALWHQKIHKNFKLSINISSHQIQHIGLVKLLNSILQETKFPPELLHLELTESTIMAASNNIGKTFKELSTMNIGISLDDFGTGYSSLYHLKILPITSLKIDKSFVMDISNDPNNALIVKSIIALGKTLNLNLIAEGIETEEQLQFLIKHKCEYGQGFYLSKPLTSEQMSQLLHEAAR